MLRIPKKAMLVGVVFLSFFAAILLILSYEKEEQESKQEQNAPRLTTIANNLKIPWALAFLPNRDILFTERAGKVKLVDKEGKRPPILVAEIDEVKHVGEGGLLGIAVHPDFENNQYVYVYYTYSNDGDNTLNKVARFKFENNKLTNKQIIVDAIPGAVNHNGGRIKFGPDNFLYITTGDAENPSLAQDRNSLAGKILRMSKDGNPVQGNPFDNLVYSYGHRNPQGLTWDSQGRLWATEHGPQAMDELNLVEKGVNYGWPIISGDEERSGMGKPILQSGSSTWAPGGTTVVGDSIFFAGLRGQALFETKIANGKFELKEHLKKELGRIRDVVLGPDGFLYLTTSNHDGRGNPSEDDDKIIRVNPNSLLISSP